MRNGHSNTAERVTTRKYYEIGGCNHCNGRAWYRVGKDGGQSVLEWERDGVQYATEYWPTGGRPAVCPPCWDRIQGERELRKKAYEAKHGPIPIEDYDD